MRAAKYAVTAILMAVGMSLSFAGSAHIEPAAVVAGNGLNHGAGGLWASDAVGSQDAVSQVEVLVSGAALAEGQSVSLYSGGVDASDVDRTLPVSGADSVDGGPWPGQRADDGRFGLSAGLTVDVGKRLRTSRGELRWLSRAGSA